MLMICAAGDLELWIKICTNNVKKEENLHLRLLKWFQPSEQSALVLPQVSNKHDH